MRVESLDVSGPVLAEVFTVFPNGASLALTGPCGAAPWLIETGGGEHPLDTARRIVETAMPGAGRDGDGPTRQILTGEARSDSCHG